MATHPHADHVAGLPAVLARFPASMVIDPGCSGPSPYYQAFLRSVRASGVPIRHPPFASVLHVGDVIIQVLGPEHCFIGTNSDPNNDSMVLRILDGAASALFPGDAEQPSGIGPSLTSPRLKWRLPAQFHRRPGNRAY